MFRGITNINLDAKGRLAIPTRYRSRLSECCDGQLVVTIDRDRCLLLYPLPDWEDIERKIMRLPGLGEPTRGLQRLLVGHATECEMDGNGRILLPPPLRKLVPLGKRVVLIGQGNKFEIWDEQRWDEQRDIWLAQSSDEALSGELGLLSL